MRLAAAIALNLLRKNEVQSILIKMTSIRLNYACFILSRPIGTQDEIVSTIGNIIPNLHGSTPLTMKVSS